MLKTRLPAYFAVALVSCLFVSSQSQAIAEESQFVTATKPIVREAAEYGFKCWLRDRVYDEQDDAKYGLKLQDDWLEEDSARPVIVQVHGFNSCCERNAAVMEPFQENNYPCAGFAYPNDYGLEASAERMSRDFKEFARQHPKRRLILITHSMGGLVARACLEDPALDPGNVDSLLMIAPPSQGTLIAKFAVATDVWEHWLSRSHGGAWARWRDSVVDGLGEAADDLTPGSEFLTTLNARRRNPHVKYAIFLGTAATMQEDELAWMMKAIRKTAGKLPGIRGSAEKLERLLADMEEVVEGKGDGVVAVKRGKLAGVDDVVILPFGHLSVTGKAESDTVRQVQAELLSRVEH